MKQSLTSASYDKQAENYDKKWKGYLENTHQQVLSVLEIESEDKVLDVSAGTGILGRHIIEKLSFSELILNDISPKMLKQARKKVGEHPNVNFINSEVQDLDLPPKYFDHIISLNAFHYYPDQVLAIQKISELLKPGGSFYLVDWNRSGFFRWVNKVIKLMADEDIHTKSLEEAAELVRQNNLEILQTKEWSYRYWKLFLIIAQRKVQ